jgi:hypothetical protein
MSRFRNMSGLHVRTAEKRSKNIHAKTNHCRRRGFAKVRIGDATEHGKHKKRERHRAWECQFALFEHAMRNTRTTFFLRGASPILTFANPLRRQWIVLAWMFLLLFSAVLTCNPLIFLNLLMRFCTVLSWHLHYFCLLSRFVSSSDVVRICTYAWVLMPAMSNLLSLEARMLLCTLLLIMWEGHWECTTLLRSNWEIDATRP